MALVLTRYARPVGLPGEVYHLVAFSSSKWVLICASTRMIPGCFCPNPSASSLLRSANSSPHFITRLAKLLSVRCGGHGPRIISSSSGGKTSQVMPLLMEAYADFDNRGSPAQFISDTLLSAIHSLLPSFCHSSSTTQCGLSSHASVLLSTLAKTDSLFKKTGFPKWMSQVTPTRKHSLESRS